MGNISFGKLCYRHVEVHVTIDGVKIKMLTQLLMSIGYAIKILPLWILK